MKKIIFIGGASGSGKSSLAKSLSKQFNIPYFSTDVMQSFMQKVVSRDTYPYLFDCLDISPEEYFEKYTPEDIVHRQNNENIDVWDGMKKFIESNDTWESYIIEGIALMPKEVSEYHPENTKMISFFLSDTNIDRIKQIIFDRGVWARADQYSDEVKKIEHLWILQYNQWLKDEAMKYHQPLIPVTTREEVLNKALEIIAKDDEK